MDFVTKEEFDKSMRTLYKALANGQVFVSLASEDSREEMSHLLFGTAIDGHSGTLVNANRISFMSPLQAVRNKAHLVGLELKKHTERSNKEQETVSKLEKELEKLTSQIKALKE